ncbi:MAG: response regulator transcription factor [Anaerolineae bacterium]
MTTTTKILVVEDEKTLREFVSRNLAARGYQVFTAANGLEALAIFNTESLDLIILDLMMPHMDGLETCRRIRQVSTLPIIILSALGEEADKVTALNLGADHYLTKPFGVEELLARVRAALRRVKWDSAVSPREVLRYGELELDSQGMLATCRGERVKLTRTEFELLHFFMQNVGKVLPHRVILKNVWGPEYGNEAEYLRVYVGRLRRKLEQDSSSPKYIVTEHGIGYRFGKA